MVKFLKRYKLSNVTEEEIDNLSSHIFIRKIKVVNNPFYPTSTPPKKKENRKQKSPGPDSSSVNSTKHFRKK